MFENLKYDPASGLFTHTKDYGRVKAGQHVSSLDSHGYIRVSYKGKRYLGHRVAFYLMTGKWPEQDVDHIDGNRTNNKWNNLREATRSQNLQNQKCTRGVSRFKGVTFNGSVFVAQIGKRGKSYIGCSKSEKEAAMIYNNAARVLFGNFARYNQVFEDVSKDILIGEA